MKTSWISAVVFWAALGGTASRGADQSIFEGPPDAVPESPLDKLVSSQLSPRGISPALCSDAVFVRRAFLDVTGTLPTAEEARAFIEDKAADKRRILIDRLLERDEFADYWAMKWSDLLRVKAEFPINLWPNAAQAYHRWIRASVRENKPYDRFVRELLTSEGSNFRVPPVNFFRAMQSRTPEGIAQTVALTFLGARAENWPKERLAGMAGFFAQVSYKSTREWKEEIVFWDPGKAVAQAAAGPAGQAPGGVPAAAVFPDGTQIKLSADRDPREVFADWLITPKNPWFTQYIANRVWSWLLGRGIIHEPDDIRPDNPPSNPALLAYLQQEMIAAHYDLKHMCRLILNSRTYQFSCLSQGNSPEGKAHFASYPLRRLEAEVLIDAIGRITGTTELYTSAIPEPFTFIPDTQTAVALPDGSITSPFLELFGRPPRDSGLDAERSNRAVPSQRLHLLNSAHIQRKLEDSAKFKALLASKRSPHEVATEVYLTILSRFPTEEELKSVDAYSKAGGSYTAWRDLVWALVNSDEFMYRH